MSTLTKVQLAEAALKEAQEQEKLEYREKELNDLIKDYKGKCFATNTFERRSNAGSKSAVYYERFFIEDGEIYVIEWNLRLSKFDSAYKVRASEINYSKNIYKRQITDGKYDAHYNLDSGYSCFKHEIPLEKFMYLWEVAEEANILITGAFNGKIPEVKDEEISQAEHGYEAVIESFIKGLGLDMIDLKDYPAAHAVLEYCTLPLFDKRRWLPKPYAKQILEFQISLWEKDKESVFATQRSIDVLNSRVRTIKDLIQKIF